MGFTVAVLGATGLVGRTLLEVLEQRAFPAGKVLALASERSAGKRIRFRGEDLEVLAAGETSFRGVDLVLASAGAAVSRRLLPIAVESGAICVDNSSAFRMEPDIPLVVPEVNSHRLADAARRRILANPNCSTIQLVVALKPLHDAIGVQRVIVSTYQSVSGAGGRAVAELQEETAAVCAGQAYSRRVFPRPIAFNVIPQVDTFLEDGETREEWKMRVETRKIMEDPIDLHATCVRVPVVRSHSESVWVELARETSVAELRALFETAPGVELADDGAENRYPTAAELAGRDEVFVGRIRRDPTHPTAVSFWIVADNIRKGAALNAVQIAEGLLTLHPPLLGTR